MFATGLRQIHTFMVAMVIKLDPHSVCYRFETNTYIYGCYAD